MKKDQTESRRAFLIHLLYYAAVVGIIWFCFTYLIGWFMPFIIGFLIAAVFNPAIRVLEQRLKFGRKVAASIVVILGYAVIVVLLTLLSLQIVSALKDLFTFLPDYVQDKIIPSLMSLDLSIDSFEHFPPQWSEQIQAIQDSITSGLTSAISKLSSTGLTIVTNFTKGVPGFLISLVFTILASFFLSFQYDKTKRFIRLQLPEKMLVLVREVKETFSDTILRYLRGYLKIMLVTFVELSIGLTILGIPNSIAIAFGIAIFDIFPVFGTGGILIPWVLIELLSGDPFRSLGLLITYGVVTVIRNFIEPKIIGDQLGLNPVISLISIYLGFVWIGVGGMIIMPICVQIAISLHRKGILHLYKEEPKPIVAGGPADKSTKADKEKADKERADKEKTDKTPKDGKQFWK